MICLRTAAAAGSRAATTQLLQRSSLATSAANLRWTKDLQKESRIFRYGYNDKVKQSGALLKTPGSSSLPGARRRAGQEGAGEHGGRTSEQGKDYLVELDGDLLR